MVAAPTTRGARVTSAGHEIELKLRVPDGAALRAVLRVAGGEQAAPVRQVNHFFDSASRALRQSAFGLRLREEGERWFLTAKGPSQKSTSGALSVRSEEEIELDGDVARSILEGGSHPLDVLERDVLSKSGVQLCMKLRHVLQDEPLACVGAFDNLRTRVTTSIPSRRGPLEVVLELDETHFPHGHIHFEVEMELEDASSAEIAEQALRDLLHLAGVEGFPSRGKASRFFAALDGHPI